MKANNNLVIVTSSLARVARTMKEDELQTWIKADMANLKNSPMDRINGVTLLRLEAFTAELHRRTLLAALWLQGAIFIGAVPRLYGSLGAPTSPMGRMHGRSGQRLSGFIGCRMTLA